ncbi:hypothetical protein AVEN_238175-1 [Araneus ventricosus]|uniref:Uncharacterized protein n=1 Tax=Araneus ventricosus TaxID=182803 RepID=A0A4Y2GAK1_ARAVE|nr:hypothetical protein AVEN_238175-1 [Araneus ventricosus]
MELKCSKLYPTVNPQCLSAWCTVNLTWVKRRCAEVWRGSCQLRLCPPHLIAVQNYEKRPKLPSYSGWGQWGARGPGPSVGDAVPRRRRIISYPVYAKGYSTIK